MTKDQARAIYKLTSLPEWELVLQCNDDRVKDLHKELETVRDIDNLKRVQGQIVELKRFKELRDIATKTLDQK